MGEGLINWGYIVHGVIKHWILKDYPNLPVGTCLFLLHDSHVFAEWRAWTEEWRERQSAIFGYLV